MFCLDNSNIFLRNFMLIFRGVCSYYWRSQAVRASSRNFALLDAVDALRLDFKARMCRGKFGNRFLFGAGSREAEHRTQSV